MRLSVSLGRSAFALGTIALWSALMVAIGRSGCAPAAVLAAALFTVPLTSLGEWLVHGVLYHGRVPGLAFIRSIHHHGHHFSLFPPHRYIQDGDYEFMRFRNPRPFEMADNALDNLLTKWSQVALHFVAGIPLILAPAWALTRSAPFFFSSLATLCAISWLLAHVHGAIHTPKDRWIERQRWFQWLDRHHYIHHVDLSSNINFMLPLCDLLFGTQKWELSPGETLAFPSFERAKAPAPPVPVAPPPRPIIKNRCTPGRHRAPLAAE